MQIAFDAKAFAAKRGDPDFGAVVVLNGLAAGAAPNRTVSGRDPTAHAEIEAIRDACRRLTVARLDGAMMYASAQPCRMCELACYHAGIARIVHGQSLTDAGAPRYEAC
jgi:tRNA(Arg) A34 adenosine deaminase TadA